MNQAELIGRTVSDAELRYTPNNTAVAQVTIAVNRDFKNSNGEREADFIRLVIWGKSAENFSSWIKKGHKVAVVGRIQTRNYEDNTGRRQYVTEVVVNNFYPLEPRNNNGQNQNGYQGQDGYNNQGQNGYQQPPQNPQSNPFGNANPMEISDDELPF